MMTKVFVLIAAMVGFQSTGTPQNATQNGNSPPASSGANGSTGTQTSQGSKGLLGIAEYEAHRTAKALNDKILNALKDYEKARLESPERGKAQLDAIVQHGADAVPVLLGLLRGIGSGQQDSAFAGPCARALAGIFDRTKNQDILKELREIAHGSSPILRAGVLEGLESLDHAMVLEIVQPMLADQDETLRVQVIRVLGKQKSNAESVVPHLKPLLQGQAENPLRAETLDALRQLADPSGLETAQGWLANPKETDPAALAAAVKYLADFGGKSSISGLKDLLTKNNRPNLQDSLFKRAVDAVQRIGLRDADARKSAEDLLVQVMNGHTSFGVREQAGWLLGPFQNKEALDRLEKPLLDAIKNNASNRGNVSDNYILLAESRIHFEQWTKAINALERAEKEDENGLRTSRIETLRAVAQCGDGKFAKTEKFLRSLTLVERLELVQKFPVLEKMSKDAKYRDLFESK